MVAAMMLSPDVRLMIECVTVNRLSDQAGMPFENGLGLQHHRPVDHPAVDLDRARSAPRRRQARAAPTSISSALGASARADGGDLPRVDAQLGAEAEGARERRGRPAALLVVRCGVTPAIGDASPAAREASAMRPPGRSARARRPTGRGRRRSRACRRPGAARRGARRWRRTLSTPRAISISGSTRPSGGKRRHARGRSGRRLPPWAASRARMPALRSSARSASNQGVAASLMRTTDALGQLVLRRASIRRCAARAAPCRAAPPHPRDRGSRRRRPTASALSKRSGRLPGTNR